MSSQADVMDQLHAAGLVVEQLVISGELQRIKAEGDRGGKRSGWYVLHSHIRDDGRELIFGAYGNYKTGTGTVTLKLDWRGMSDTEQADAKRKMEEARARAASEQRERAAEAAKRAAEIWPTLPEEGRSGYLERKGVGAFGVRYAKGGAICVPVRSNRGGLRGLQFIQPDGTKRFLTGTAKRGAYHLLGDDEPEFPLLLCEGYATAASVHMATGWTACVAFDAGNLRHVSGALRKRFPERPIFVMADMDVNTPGNPGLTQAREAVRDDRMEVVPSLVLENPRQGS